MCGQAEYTPREVAISMHRLLNGPPLVDGLGLSLDGTREGKWAEVTGVTVATGIRGLRSSVSRPFGRRRGIPGIPELATLASSS